MKRRSPWKRDRWHLMDRSQLARGSRTFSPVPRAGLLSLNLPLGLLGSPGASKGSLGVRDVATPREAPSAYLGWV